MWRLFCFLLFFGAVPFCLGQTPPASSNKVLEESDVISLRDGKFYLDGKPFAEISFNKFDLFWALYNELLKHRELNEQNAIVKAQENALLNLHKMGFRSVRIFAFPWGDNAAEKFQDPDSHRIIFEALDKTIELCERYHIGIIWSLGCNQFTDDKEHLKELCANPSAVNREVLRSYLFQVIDRYKNSPAVLMWEIGNELTLSADVGDENGVFNGKRMPTLHDVASFYNDVAKIIKSIDPLRLVNNGGANPREYQWNLYLKNGWKKDTYDQQSRCFDLLFRHSAVDVVDIHYYATNKGGPKIAGDDGSDTELSMTDYMGFAAQEEKPLMVGELGCTLYAKTNQEVWAETPNYMTTISDANSALPWVNKVLNNVVNAGVPLSYWWAYQSDRDMDQNDPMRLDVSFERNPEIINAIIDANKRLKQKLGIKSAG